MTTLDFILAICHLVLLAPLAVLGLHKAWMIALWLRQRQPQPADTGESTPDGDLPSVTVQLPVYNERFVVARLIDAVASISYPRDRLEIQILDDSTDDTGDVIGAVLRDLPDDLAIHHIRRDDRTGFKAGALAHGLKSARGELIAVFDADFVPPSDFLRRTVAHFIDARIGLVQARWGHTNREHSLLTEMQAMLLDGHFAIEQPARATNRCFFNFNGTAGVFRRECIDDAGGWSHDTLTEDMDLSYRAQLRGWRFVYLPQLRCPAELPVDMNGYLTQQHRWAKGSIQTARKLLGKVWSAPLPLLTKVESVFHLVGNIAFPLLLAVVLVAMPMQLLRAVSQTTVPIALTWLEGLPLILATFSVFAYYGLSQVTLSRFDIATILRLPLILVLGAGTSLNNTLAVLGGLGRDPGEFKRTPKHTDNLPANQRREASYHSPRGRLPFLELTLGCWAGTTTVLAAAQGQWFTAAFHALFATGFVWVGLQSLRANLRYRAVLPLAVLASCGGGGDTTVPVIVPDRQPDLVACQARIEREHSLTEIIRSTRQGLVVGDLPSRAGMEFGVRVAPDGERVVFARERKFAEEKSREIFVAPLDGSQGERRLTGNNSADDSPCWSPDGTQILFSSARAGGRTLWRMDVDGDDPQAATTGNVEDRDPDWHASGIVFSRTDKTAAQPRARLYLMPGPGTAAQPITAAGQGLGDFEPAWAPDGKSVLFVRAFSAEQQVLMQLTFGQPAPVVIGDGAGEDRFPRWSPQGDRIFVARSRPATGLDGLRLYATLPDGSAPRLLFPDQRFAYLGFDPTPAMQAYVPPEEAPVAVEVAAGKLTMRLGVVSRGLSGDILKKDGEVLGINTQLFEGREVAGILLTLGLPVTKPESIASLRIEVTAAITRTDDDSFVRLALHNAQAQRFDSVVKMVPGDTKLHTYTFTTASLAHMDRNGEIQLEVIGDVSEGTRAELIVDHIGVVVELHPR